MAGRDFAAGSQWRPLIDRMRMLHQQELPGFDQRSWSGLTDEQRKRMAAGSISASAVALVGGNAIIGLETFLLVQLALNGGNIRQMLSLDTALLWAMLLAIVGGTALNLVFGLIALRPHLNWFYPVRRPSPVGGNRFRRSPCGRCWVPWPPGPSRCSSI